MVNLFPNMNAMRMIARTLALGVVLFGGLLATQTHAAGPIVSITVTPATTTMTADQSQAFTVTATDTDGLTSDVTSGSTLSSNDPLGSMSGATYHAGQVGTWEILAVYQSFSDTAAVTVTPGELKELVINPHSDPEYVNQGSTKQFSVRGYDAHNNEISNLSPTWSIIGEIGSINASGLFSAERIGTGQVRVTVGTITGQIPVVVKEAPVQDANTNSNTNTGTNTNSGTNVNANSNGNTNSSTNTNTDEPATNTNTAVGNDDQAEEVLHCTTMATWLWVIVLVVFLIGVAILYALVPMSRIWPAIIGLGGAIALIIVHRTYGCDLLSWWDWILALATLGLGILALRQLPLPKPPEA